MRTGVHPTDQVRERLLRPVMPVLLISNVSPATTFNSDGEWGGGLMQYGRVLVILALVAPGLAGCATPAAMTVNSSTVVASNPKYRNAIAVRSVTGGQVMNALTIMGVAN